MVGNTSRHREQVAKRRSRFRMSCLDRFQILLKGLLWVSQDLAHLFIRPILLAFAQELLHVHRVPLATIHRVDEHLVQARPA